MLVEGPAQPEEPEQDKVAFPAAKSGLPNPGCLPRLAGDPPRNWEPVWRGVSGLGERRRTRSRESKNTKTTGD